MTRRENVTLFKNCASNDFLSFCPALLRSKPRWKCRFRSWYILWIWNQFQPRGVDVYVTLWVHTVSETEFRLKEYTTSETYILRWVYIWVTQGKKNRNHSMHSFREISNSNFSSKIDLFPSPFPPPPPHNTIRLSHCNFKLLTYLKRYL